MKDKSDIIKKVGWNIINSTATNENSLWNLMILSMPMYLSKNLAKSPEIMRVPKKNKPINPANFPIE